MHSTIKKTTLYLLQIAISGILMLVLMPIISKYLAPSDFGQFVLAQVYASVAVGIANLGVLVGYERNFFIFEKSSEDSAKLISSAVVFVAFNLAILLVAVYIFQLEISSLILADNTPNDLLLIVFVGASASSLSQYYLTFLKNSGLAKSYAKYMIVNSVINFIIAIWLITQSSFGVMSLAYAWIISNLILLFLLFLTLRKKLPLSFDKKMLKGVLKISLPLTPRVFFGFMNTQLDKILLGLIGSSSLVGIYHVGQTFALTIFQFMTGLDRVFQPEIYRKLFASKHINNPYEINNYILPFFYISIFMALVVALFSSP
jgi:O-antigen/teichoic acid export membrane protein